MRSVIVAGAGIVGAALAFRLARDGWAVSVLDEGPVAGQASGRSFGWINASFHQGEAHFHLRHAAITAHRRLAADLPGSGQQWAGCLWAEEDGPGFDDLATRLYRLHYPMQVLSRAEIAAREPALADPPPRAILFPTEGAVDAAQLAHRLLADAAGHGATILTGVRITGLHLAGGAVAGVVTAQGPMMADAVVLATGRGTPELLAGQGLHLPMLHRPGALLATRPMPPLLRHVLALPGQEVRQDASGRLLLPLAEGGHQGDPAEALVTLPADLARAALARLARHLPGITPEVETIALAERPVPGDGLPVIGPVPGLPGAFVAVLHSAVTLAPVVADFLADEIAGRHVHRDLMAFRPDRLIRRAE